LRDVPALHGGFAMQRTMPLLPSRTACVVRLDDTFEANERRFANVEPTMMQRAIFLAAPLFASLVWMTGCDPIEQNKTTDGGSTNDAAVEASADAGATNSITCYIAPQFICDDYPNPTPSQVMEVPVACSSASGDLQAKCPEAGFKGKCTRVDGPTIAGPYVERFYTGADLAYAQDFCVNTAHGFWSTTF
jgi:hypothetical protein